MADLIDRQWLMERLGIKEDCRECQYCLGPLCSKGSEFVKVCEAIMDAPSAQPDSWMEQNKDKILQAGKEGREIEFRIGGRLFAIREKAQ